MSTVAKARRRVEADDQSPFVEATIKVRRDQLTIVQAPPITLTQHNCEQAAGVKKRTFLESLDAFEQDGGKVGRPGKLRVVDRIAYTSWLQSRRPSVQATGADPVTDLLVECGFARA